MALKRLGSTNRESAVERPCGRTAFKNNRINFALVIWQSFRLSLRKPASSEPSSPFWISIFLSKAFNRWMTNKIALVSPFSFNYSFLTTSFLILMFKSIERVDSVTSEASYCSLQLYSYFYLRLKMWASQNWRRWLARPLDLRRQRRWPVDRCTIF